VDVTLVNAVNVSVELDVNVDVVDETVVVVDVLGITEVEIDCEVDGRAKMVASSVVADTTATDRVKTAVAVACTVAVLVIGGIVETVVDVTVLVNNRLEVSWSVKVDVVE
jgi:hypothetical protein